jgi:hypothetical protein
LPNETTRPRNDVNEEHEDNKDSDDSDNEGDENNDEIQFTRDANVWYLYLEDAEREASEKAELWKTGLDSLLIFVSVYPLTNA